MECLQALCTRSFHRSAGKDSGVASTPEHNEEIARLTENVAGEIRNPLRGIPRDQLLKNVAQFQHDKGLSDDILPLLRKGALVAQNPAGFETLEDLDENEKKALREEVTHRWKQPVPLYYTIFLNSIAAAIQGWDQVRTSSTPFLIETLTWLTL